MKKTSRLLAVLAVFAMLMTALPLSALTEGIHTHGLRCPDRQTLEQAREMLRSMHILQE